MFESVIADVRNKFNLGDKARDLLSALLALITDSNRGGFAGFINKLNETGLDDVASSWINSGTNTPISSEQVKSVLGTEAINEMAQRVGLDEETTTAATAFMLPQVVDQLTTEGFVPNDDDIRLKTGRFFSESDAAIDSKNVGEAFDRIGSAAIGNNTENEEVISDDNSILKWLLPLIILALLIGLGFWFCGKSAPSSAVAPSTNNNANKANVNVNANGH